MQIRKKTDIDTILDNFSSIAEWDAQGKKLYFIFPDRKRGGQWTLMYYTGDRFSIHGLGESYMDDAEYFFEDRLSLVSFLWDNRSAFNSAVRQAIPDKLAT